jgi:membrane protein YdbS with pleckstrin-like domain
MRDGRIARAENCVRFSKIQSVSLSQNPLDRRLRMARLRVDTASSDNAQLGFVIPYLGLDVARELMQRLRREAAAVEFRW